MTTKDIGKRTGLGLSMVYGFARQSDGTVLVKNESGVGAEFALWLPRATVAADRPAAGKPVEAANNTVKGARILLVDDHDGVRTVTQELLTDLGHQAVSANCTADAMEILRQEKAPFDVLLTDYAMPRGSRTDLIRQVRKLYPKLPAIIMTGYADSEMIADRPKIRL